MNEYIARWRDEGIYIYVDIADMFSHPPLFCFFTSSRRHYFTSSLLHFFILLCFVGSSYLHFGPISIWLRLDLHSVSVLPFLSSHRSLFGYFILCLRPFRYIIKYYTIKYNAAHGGTTHHIGVRPHQLIPIFVDPLINRPAVSASFAAR